MNETSNGATGAIIPPGSTIGILGGGQLGRMTALAAAPLGYQSLIFEPQAGCPASHVAPHIAAAYDDWNALSDFADQVDVVTLEFENVPVEVLDFLDERVPVRPGSSVLSIAQDRKSEKTFLNEAGIETAPWAPVHDEASLASAVNYVGKPSILKSARLGYDGKGQTTLKEDTDPLAAWEAIGRKPAILEGFVDFTCEVSVIVARAPNGETACFPTVMNDHKNHILYKTTAPAPIDENIRQKAQDAALTAARAFDVYGLLAVEMFVTPDGRILANEVAPRPHNSGHWTIEGCRTSQFEQLVRAVCNLPLGDMSIRGRSEMINLLGDDIDGWADYLKQPGTHLHLYGKAEAKPGRKMGHITRVFD